MNQERTYAVNVESDRYLQVNNCSLQIRPDNFTVTRKDGWNDWQLLLIISGECIVYHKGCKYHLYPGGVILYAPKEPQKYIFLNECKSLWMHFSGTSVQEILDSCALQSGVWQLNYDPHITELFFLLIQRFNHEITYKYTNASVIELLCCVSDKVHNTDTINCPVEIQNAVDYLNQNYLNECTIFKLCEISGYSRSQFSLLFKKYMKKTPMEYQRSLRLNSSRELLCSTNLTISEIAFCCGYDDALYFSRIFKKQYGMSPSQYRENNSIL